MAQWEIREIDLWFIHEDGSVAWHEQRIRIQPTRPVGPP